MRKRALWRLLASATVNTLWVVRIVCQVVNVVVDALADHIASGDAKRKIDVRLASVVGASVIALYLEPTVNAGLAKGDVFKAYMAGYELATAEKGPTTLAAFRRELPTHSLGQFPLDALPLLVWQSSPRAGDLRALQLFAVAVNAMTFAWFVARASDSGALTLLALAMTGLATQLRLQGDPILGPVFAAPLAVEFGFLTLLGAVSFGRSANLWWFALAFGAALGAALTDGLGYVTCVVGSIALLSRGFELRRAACAIALVAIPIVCIGVSSKNAPPAAFASARPTLLTAFESAVAAVPTSYRAAGHLVVEAIKPSNADTRFTKFGSPGFAGWLTILAIGSVVLIATLRSRSDTSDNPAALAACASALWALPACLTAAHIPALPMGAPREGLYFETFGVGLLIALAINASARRATDAAATLAVATTVALLASIVAFGNVRSNGYILERVANNEGQRRALESAASVGLFADIPANAAIILSGVAGLESGTTSPRDGRYLLFAISNKHYVTFTHASISLGGILCRIRRDKRRCSPLRDDVYIMTSQTTGPGTQAVTALHWAGSDPSGPLTDRGTRFNTEVIPDLATLVSKSSFPGSGVVLAAQSSGGGTLTHMRRLCGPVATANAFSASVPQVIWGAGFYAPYPARPFIAANSLPTRTLGHNPWAFSGRVAHMIVSNVSCGGSRVRFSAKVFTAQPAVLRVRYAGIERTYETSQDGTIIEFTIPMASTRTSLTLETDASSAPDLYIGGREADATMHDYRMLVTSPAAKVEAGW